MGANQFLKRRNTVFFSFILLSVLPLMSLGQPACEAINCDCAVLPKDDWKNVCKSRELAIKTQCREGKDVETLYCASHGPKANHLALTLKFHNVEVLATDKLPELYKRVAALYWSMRMDLQAVESDFESSKMDTALAKVDVVLRNTDALFEIQEQITISWIAYEKEDEAAQSWSDFASDSKDIAKRIIDSGKKFWNISNALKEPERAKAEAIALALIENAGKLYEQVGYAYGEAGQDDNAALAWRKAADTSAYLIEVNDTKTESMSKLDTLKYQRAARLYRASFHSVKDKREGETTDSLKKAQELFDGKGNAIPG